MPIFPPHNVLVAINIAGASGRDCLSGILMQSNAGLNWRIHLVQDMAKITDDLAGAAARPDGIITEYPADPAACRTLKGLGIPVVFTNFPEMAIPRYPRASFIRLDDEAVGARAYKDVKPEEYAEFYRHLTHDWRDPLETVPFSGEGQVEFKALLFLPKKATMEIFMPNQKRGLSLYVRNVFIGDDIEMLLPPWLRFVKGVVDSSDLPLNVSREMLQDDEIIRKIKSAVTAKVLSTLETLKKDAKRYGEFFAAFGTVLKEGVHTDWENADRIKKLLTYPTARTEPGTRVFLADYVKDMASGQKDIYYLLAEREEDARRSPQLEAARKHGCDVLLFCDPVDEYLTESLREFDGHSFVDIGKGDVQFGSDEEKKAEKDANEKSSKELKPFLESVKKALEAQVSDVRVSTRLTDSPCCLVAQANAMPPSMVRMMRAMHQEVPDEKRILEINPSHPLIKKMSDIQSSTSTSDFNSTLHLLYDAALIAEGSPVADGARFAKLLAELMMK